MDCTWLRRSLIAQAVLAVYFQAVVWFPLGSLNDQGGVNNRPLLEQIKAGRTTSGDFIFVLAFIMPVLLFLIGYLKRIRVLPWLCLAGYAVWLALQIQTWWSAYIFGASENWQRVYHRVFARTLKILPSFGNHLAPDAMHFLMQLLLVAVIVSGVIGLIGRGRAKTMKAGAVVKAGGGDVGQ